jgi:glycosyltransferase involved in cell wall biosynthesis
MKILLLPSYYPSREHPILGTFFREQARALARAGIEVDVLSCESRSLRELSLAGLRKSHWQVESRWDNGVFEQRVRGWNPGSASPIGGRIWSYLALRAFVRYMKMRGRPDVIHAHNSLWAGYAASLIHRRFGILYVLTEHNSAFRVGRIATSALGIIKRSGDNAAARLVVSHALGKAYEGYVSKPLRVVPNVVDTGFFKLPQAPRASAPFTFLAVGNLLEAKGFHILLQAFADRYSNDETVQLQIAGAGPERERLLMLASELRIKSRVKLLGLLNREEIRGAMWNANAFVHPSFQETFGVAIIEAMATGLPVVATRCGGPEDFMNPTCGVMVSPRNTKELGQALIEVQTRTWNAEAIRHFVESRFSSEVVASMLIETYTEAIRGEGCRH